MTLKRGTIKKVMVDRCYGFLTGTDGTQRFFHLHDLADGTTFADILEGQAVTFTDDASDARGPRAVDVQAVA